MRILAALLLCAGSAIAAPFAVQVGDARLALDTPAGFADVQAMASPRLLELAESLTSASNRILLFALEDADVRRFSLGDSPELRRYVIVVTPKSLESARTTFRSFSAPAADTWVPPRFTDRSFRSWYSSGSPASVTWVPYRITISSCASRPMCRNPASVISVWVKSRFSSRGRSSR